ncbi:hypothetical protein HDU96_004732 [Phlyctochytrium bullatum]|nr:hypothetical protein HDU96_004732 [Phlyctochytrium bullatum]
MILSIALAAVSFVATATALPAANPGPSRAALIPSFIPFTGRGFAGSTEGAGIDSSGDIYGVNFNSSVAPQPKGTVTTVGIIQEPGRTGDFIDLRNFNTRGKMLLNGIRFDQQGNMFIADAGNHVVFKYPKGQPVSSTQVVCDFENIRVAEGGVPNDLVIASDGTIYVSGMNYGANTGGIYSCNPTTKEVKKLYEGKRTNGIDLDPSQNYLYFTEGGAEDEWINRISLAHPTAPPTRIYTFPTSILPSGSAADLDGIRFDRSGNLYVALNGAGKVGILYKAAQGPTNDMVVVGFEKYITNPSNLEIGFRNGEPTVFVLGSKFVDGNPVAPGMVVFNALDVGRQIAFLRKL